MSRLAVPRAARHAATPRPRRLRLAALATGAALLLCAPARAQSGQEQGAQPGQQPSAAAPAAAPGPDRTVAVDATGGPGDLADRLAAAIAAWKQAAPTLAGLSVDPSAASEVVYAPPALLGPDTYSLDLRTPGRSGTRVEVAATAVQDHPMVLLHEVGVLLGLPEGEGDVMAYAVPSSGEPQAPSPADVQTLREQRTFAPEDLNHDGAVDFYDLVLFGQDFGTQGVNLPADFNHDGRVDRQDLELLRKAYTFSPPSQTAPGAQATPQDGGSAAGTGTDAGGTAQGGTSTSSSDGATSSPPPAPSGTGP